LSGFAKLWCSFLMLVGRLELFTLLIIFSPYFWKKN
jgi:trk system potassium uptake protein TrkH